MVATAKLDAMHETKNVGVVNTPRNTDAIFSPLDLFNFFCATWDTCSHVFGIASGKKPMIDGHFALAYYRYLFFLGYDYFRNNVFCGRSTSVCIKDIESLISFQQFDHDAIASTKHYVCSFGPVAGESKRGCIKDREDSEYGLKGMLFELSRYPVEHPNFYLLLTFIVLLGIAFILDLACFASANRGHPLICLICFLGMIFAVFSAVSHWWMD